MQFRMFTTWRAAASAGLLSVLTAATAAAADYPTTAVRLITPYAAGGAVDMMARVISKPLSDRLGQQVVVDNRGGAGGTLAAEQVARAAPDGYTIFIGATGPLAISPAVYDNVKFDTLKDFTPITLIATTPYVLVANPAVPAKSVGELIELARAKPGELNYASSGTGGPDHLAGELFKMMAKIDAVHIPFKGAGPALTDLVAGRVQFEFVSPLPSMPLVEADKLRLLAVTSAKRSPSLPDVPTVAEAGLDGFNVTPWYALFAPAGTPQPIVDRLNAEMRHIMADAEVRTFFLDKGLQIELTTPAELGQFMKAEVDKWGDIARAADVKAN